MKTIKSKFGNFQINNASNNDIGFWGYNWNGKLEWIQVDIKYVHQLQNLYFALTSNELKL